MLWSSVWCVLSSSASIVFLFNFSLTTFMSQTESKLEENSFVFAQKEKNKNEWCESWAFVKETKPDSVLPNLQIVFFRIWLAKRKNQKLFFRKSNAIDKSWIRLLCEKGFPKVWAYCGVFMVQLWKIRHQKKLYLRIFDWKKKEGTKKKNNVKTTIYVWTCLN